MIEENDVKPLVSIVIPTHNMAKFIGQAIESVLAQTFQNFEIIVVDDASADDTAEVVTTILDSRLCYLRQPERGGPSAARNTGISAAQGELIALLDADDMWLPTKLAKQVALFQQDPQVGVVYCGDYEVDVAGRILRSYVTQRSWPRAGDEAFRRIACQDETLLAPLSSMVIRKACFDEVGLFDEQIVQAEEWDWIFRLAYRWNIDYVPEPLVHYRMTGSFLPEKRLRRGMQEAHITILERGFAQVNSNPRWDALKQFLLAETLWVTALYWYAIEQPERAQQNLVRIAAILPGFLDFTHNPGLLQSIAYAAWGLYDTVTPLNQALDFVNYVFAHLPESVHFEQRTREKTMAKVCAICAFDSYPRNEARRVWHSIVKAILHDPTWLKNRGLLQLPLRVMFKYA